MRVPCAYARPAPCLLVLTPDRDRAARLCDAGGSQRSCGVLSRATLADRSCSRLPDCLSAAARAGRGLTLRTRKNIQA